LKINYHDLGTGTGMAICSKCGVAVIDKTLHTDFHQHLSQIKDFMDQHQAKM